MSKSKNKKAFTQYAYLSEKDTQQELSGIEAQPESEDGSDGLEAVSDVVTDSAASQEDLMDQETESVVSKDELARAVAEAEQRGYMRGRNEAMSHPMRRNGIWEQPHREEDVSPVNDGVDDTDDLVLLRRIRPSIWD